MSRHQGQKRSRQRRLCSCTPKTKAIIVGSGSAAVVMQRAIGDLFRARQNLSRKAEKAQVEHFPRPKCDFTWPGQRFDLKTQPSLQ